MTKITAILDQENIINLLICVVLGLVLYTILLIPYGFILVPLLLEEAIPFSLIHIYFLSIFLFVGIVIGLVSKMKPWIPTTIVMIGILLILSLIDTFKKEIIFNLMTVMQTISIIIGGYLGRMLRKRRKQKNDSNLNREDIEKVSTN